MNTAVAGLRGSRLARTRPWLDLTAPVWRGHDRGWTSRLPFDADTAVAGPHGSRLAWTRPWRAVSGGHSRDLPSRDLVLECLIADAVRELEAGQKG
ncbi:MAG: hypothetical protein JNN17_19505 [Verrucomicrobiaceae bacterium]|nr:hypothetical protein [Verrucomicrobiaceae bacterium]